jgi:hypothetical protein
MPIRYSSVVGGTGGTGFNLDIGSSGNTTFVFSEAQSAGGYSVTSQLSDSTIEFYAIAADGSLAGYTNTKSLIASKDFTKIVVYGATNNDLITCEFKETTLPTSSGQETSGVAPFLSSATPSSLPNADDTTTVTGGNFANDITIKFIGQDEIERAPKSIVRSSSTELIVTRPDDFPTTQEPYSMTAANPGINISQYAGTLTDYFDAGAVVSWITNAGGLSSKYTVGSPYSTTIQATDPDGGSVSYSIITGQLPNGLFLNSSTGEISGTVSSTDDQTFTIRATDTGGNTADREFTIVEALPATVEYLVIAGGGGGGPGVTSDVSGGGGAGGYRSSVVGESSGRGAAAESIFNAIVGTAYSVEIGAGGAGIATAGATNGNDSTFASITSLGGGHPGGLTDPPAWQAPSNGGSGGGSNEAYTTGGTGATGQGYDGGSNSGGAYNAGGGGGGAGGNGGNGTTGKIGGNGGAGITSAITGTSIGRAGGGGATGQYGSGSATAGGGAGQFNAIGSNGSQNTGGGGGGGNRNGGSGGSGVVILKYNNQYSLSAGPGLVYSTDSSSVAGYNITSFTAGSDTITFS